MATTQPILSQAKLLRLDPKTGTVRSRSYRVEVIAGPNNGQTFPLAGPLVVGSAEEAGIALSDGTVSRYHLELTPRGDGVHVRDLGSTNGTYVAGVRVQDALVEDEVTLTVGTTRLRVRFLEEDLGAPVARASFGAALGDSPAMRQLFGMLARIAPTQSTVVLLGETGTGKEVLARAIHDTSLRAAGPFVVFDCASVAPSLIESELFGHVRGAFTGAISDRQGAFLRAHGGTLFLDEIGELPLELQPRLLRVLEDGLVRRVGDDKSRSVDVRIVAATHRDLEKEVESGRFRRDLFFRLAVAPVMVPPLRDRTEDIGLLASHFWRSANPEVGPPARLLALLARQRFPGNVRELRNVIERAVALFGGAQGMDGVADQELEAQLFAAPRELLARPAAPSAAAPTGELDERERILDALQRCAGNQTLAAKMLGISRGTLLTRLDTYGIPRPRKPSA